MQLVINTRGTSLRRRGERFVLKPGENPQIELAASKVSSIVIATGVHLSSNALHLAAERNIDVVFLDPTGQPISRVWQTRMGSTVQIRRRQLKVSETGESLTYERIEAPLDGFAGTVEAFFAARGRGLNVTVPFKGKRLSG